MRTRWRTAVVNFVAVVDTNNKRRAVFVEKARREISPVEGLVVSSDSNDCYSIVWAGGQWTPSSNYANGEKSVSLWGEAFEAENGRVDAERLERLWKLPLSSTPPSLDGFYAGIAYQKNKGVVVGADSLGVFPVYHYSDDETLLVGSSPELFRHHPSFKTRLNVKGLVGILLTNCQVAGRTLLENVTRLGAGSLLTWNLGTTAKEIKQNVAPTSTKYFGLSLSEQVDVLDSAFADSIGRYTDAKNRYCLMLSGGLDSRLIGGYLKRKGLKVVALTEGVPTDNELKCASKVSSLLGFAHRLVDLGVRDYATFAEIAAKWEHLAGGFGVLRFWGLPHHLREISDHVVSGYLCDGVLGSSLDMDLGTDDECVSFDLVFEKVNKWAFETEELKKLVGIRDLNKIVADVLNEIKEEYHRYSGLDFQRAWQFGLYYRMRFHIGSLLWPLTFGAWPILPATDHSVLEAAGGMPFSAMKNRFLEKKLLCTRFPELAKLPIDRFNYDNTPLKPSWAQIIKQQALWEGVIWRASRHARRLRQAVLDLRGERRYYFRTSDFNSSGWKDVRRMVKSAEKSSLGLLFKEVSEKLLPSEEIAFKTENPVVESSRLKTLLGLVLWAEEHTTISVSVQSEPNKPEK